MNRKQRDSNRRNAAKLKRFAPFVPCLNCGERGPHFVPPSFGKKGFFACKTK